jgi:hypothetical protein
MGCWKKKILKYCDKFEHCSYVFEKEGAERHAHTQAFFPDGKYKGDIKKTFLRFVEQSVPDWDVAQKRVPVIVRICYNNWIEGYCADNELKSKEHSDHLKMDVPLDEDNYYPSVEEQEKAKASANAADPIFHKLTLLYDEHPRFKDNKYPDLSL